MYVRGVKERVFRDPVHGLIEFTGADAILTPILETNAMQRLRRIRQMGMASLVYPGAEHSRFGHALGAFQVAKLVTGRLDLPPEIRLHVHTAALLHDIGHGPFSHAWEQVYPSNHHETWSAKIVTEDPEMAEVLHSIDPQLTHAIKGIWDKSYVPQVASQLVSSQLDVDRMDYLLRDSHFSGARYAQFDLEWLIHALQLSTTSDEASDGTSNSRLVINYQRGRFAVEQYLFSRLYMYAQVYHHKTVRATELLFLAVMRRFTDLAKQKQEPSGLAVAARWARGDAIGTAEYICLTDTLVLAAMDGWANGSIPCDDAILRDLSQRLVRRRLFKTIELGEDPAVLDRLRDEVLSIAQSKFGEVGRYYVALDAASQVGYESTSGTELTVVGHPRHGTIGLGQLLESFAADRQNTSVRIICAPELREDIAAVANRYLNALTN